MKKFLLHYWQAILFLIFLPLFIILSFIFLPFQFDQSIKSPIGISDNELQKNNIFGPKQWENFRGNATLSGVIPHTLPQKNMFLAPTKLRWAFTTKDAISATPVVSNGHIFVGSQDGILYCLQLQDGQVLWQRELGHSPEIKNSLPTSPQITPQQTTENKSNQEQPVYGWGGIFASALLLQDHVLVGTQAGFFYCLDQKNGELLWRYDTTEKILGAANAFYEPNTQQYRVIVGSYDTNLHCLSASSGQLLWKYATTSYINGTPAIDGLIGVVGSCDSQLYVIDLLTGKSQVVISTGAHIAGSPVISQDQVIVGNYSNTIVAVSIAQSKIMWEFHTTNKESAFCSIPALNEHVVILGSRQGMVYCLDRHTGKLRWEFATYAEVDSPPVLFGQTVLFGARNGRIYAIDIDTGKKLWALEVGSEIISAPVIIENSLLITSLDGKIQLWDMQIDN